MNDLLHAAIKLTDKLISMESPHPAVFSVRDQLRQLAEGRLGSCSLARIIAHEFTPAPDAYTENWADLILQVAAEYTDGNS